MKTFWGILLATLASFAFAAPFPISELRLDGDVNGNSNRITNAVDLVFTDGSSVTQRLAAVENLLAVGISNALWTAQTSTNVFVAVDYITNTVVTAPFYGMRVIKSWETNGP